MRRLSMISCITWALVASSQALAAEAGPQKNQVFISLLGGYYEEPSNLDLTQGSNGLGGTLGWAYLERWSVEAMFMEFEPTVEVGGTRAEGDMEYYALNLIGKIGSLEERSLRPYVTFGGGRGDYEYAGLRSDEEENIYNAGLGFFGRVGDRVSLRADVRALYHDDADSFSPMATAGITIKLGATAPPPPSDSDGDGVPDSRDACPGTPAGTEVDSRGCERDSDGDGVADGDDRCPDTPAGVTVDDQGCALDSDGDGVPDHRDDCPDTPAGARVDDRGCEVELERPVSFDLTVTFGFDSAEITGVAFQEMLELLRFLRQYPSTTAVIEGHTDSQGAEEYNQNLSERRAQAVVEALVNSGIDRDRLTARGYGESRPIASNETEAGRAENRRVTVVVSGTTTREPSS